MLRFPNNKIVYKVINKLNINTRGEMDHGSIVWLSFYFFLQSMRHVGFSHNTMNRGYGIDFHLGV